MFYKKNNQLSDFSVIKKIHFVSISKILSKCEIFWGGDSKTQTKIYIPDITKDQTNFWWQSRIFPPLPPPEILLQIWPF
jgi:hypothetical protein